MKLFFPELTVNNTRMPEDRKRRLAPVAAAAGLALVTGAWAGLARLGLHVGAAPAELHGPLMILGFLGTVITVERAVGLGRTWAWTAPAAAGAGGVLMLAGGIRVGAVLSLVAGVVLVLVYLAAISITGWEPHLAVEAAGAAAWVVGAAALVAGKPVPAAVPALTAFLVLTICGERLELSRMGRPRSAWWRRLVMVAAAFTVLAAGTAVADLDLGSRFLGAAVVVLAAASVWGDIARRTIRTSGVTRYMAAALLAGYAWLALGGVVWTVGGLDPGSFAYDVALHAVLIGFVLSMVFGHAPVIVPAVAQVDLPYRRSWWVALALLHGSLVLRMAAAPAASTTMRTWGGALNVVALSVFIALAARSAIIGRKADMTA